MRNGALASWLMCGCLLIPGMACGDEEAVGVWQVRVEVWEVEKREWVVELDEMESAGEWRKAKLGGEASRLVHAPMVIVSSREMGIVASVEEFIYPVEYDSGGGLEGMYIPPEAAVAEPKPEPETLGAVLAGLMPLPDYNAFETRNVGMTLQARMRSDLYLFVSLEEVRMAGFETWGINPASVAQPNFESYHVSMGRRVEPGRWALGAAQEARRGLDAKPGSKMWVMLLRVDAVE